MLSTSTLSRMVLGAVTVLLFVTVVSAQTPPAIPADVFAVNYYSHANEGGAPDGTVRITNPGTTGGNLCAMIYVFTPDQQMAECCGCSVTPNALRTLSVNSDLTSNPLTAVVPTNGAIKIVSSVYATPCDPKKPTPIPALRSWATHIQTNPALGSPSITETESLDATLSSPELVRLAALCRSIFANGSGHGVCSCGAAE